MKCPKCQEKGTKVVDSRPTDEDRSVRRRRECESCDTRFTTYERTSWDGLQVEKRNGEMEPFDSDKLLGGILRAVEKRPIDGEEAEQIAYRIEKQIRDEYGSMVSSDRIGELVMEKLKEIDEVAYMRFVSVYKEFSDASQFAQELDRIDN